MSKLLMLKGLPGSGKSTYASTFASTDPSYRIVNKDDIRRELEVDGWTWTHANEKQVLAIRDERIRTHLLNLWNVISDDTNFGRKHEIRLRELAEEAGATFELMVINTPLEECLLRDSAREGKAKVGEKVIRGMAMVNGLLTTTAPTPFAPYVIPPGDTNMDAIICDLDGTLSLLTQDVCSTCGRAQQDALHLPDGPQGSTWHPFTPRQRNPYDPSTCNKDLPNLPIKLILETFYRFMHYQIIYLSGREDKYRPQTEEFLRTHHCPPGPLLMRPTGDFSKDYLIKGELFDAHVREKYHVRFVMDDRDQVVKFWRSINLTCLQVAEGNF